MTITAVALGPTELETSAIGFGCSRLFRLKSTRERQTVLETAFECGIRHYDVARMYGMGYAEAEVGRFARDKRDQIVIATKFGIQPGRLSRTLGRHQRFLRSMFSALPQALKGKIRARRRPGPPKRFDAALAEQHLATSLAELSTDYVDLYLLHEPTVHDEISSDLEPWLEKQRKVGKIREYGISGVDSDIVQIGRRHPELCRVVQFKSDIFDDNVSFCRESCRFPVITFGVFENAYGHLVSYLRANRGARLTSVKSIQCASVDEGELAHAIIACSVRANNDGVVLFSTTQPSRVREWVRAAELKDDAMCNDLLALVEEIRTKCRPSCFC